MLKFIKNFSKKKNISTATMSDKEYIEAIEGEILPYWADKVLMEKTGIRDLFAEGATIQKELSYEDAMDCGVRSEKMLAVANYVVKQFGSRSKALKNDPNATKAQRDKFYSADTIRDLFIEAQESIPLRTEFDADWTYENVVHDLQLEITGFHTLKDVIFSSITLFSELDFGTMAGFHD